MASIPETRIPRLGRFEMGRRWTATDEVYAALRTLVVDGVLKPGDRLTEISLAARLSVSRTPLRHALQRLTSEGWLFRSANGAIRVVDVSEREIEALYAVRVALEEMMMDEAAKRLSPSALKELRDVLLAQDQAVRARNPDLVSEQGEQFHRMLWRLSENRVGAEFLENVLQRTTRYRRLSFTEPYRFREGVKQHWQILRALEAGNALEARRVLRVHIGQSRNYVMQAFRAWQSASRTRETNEPGHPLPASKARAKRSSPPPAT